MKLEHGNLSLTRFKIISDKSIKITTRLDKHLEGLKSIPINNKKKHTKEIISGWVNPRINDDHEFKSETDWGITDCAINEDILLRMRLEKRKVPATLLQMLSKEHFDKIELKTGAKVKIPERRQYNEELQYELLKQALPQISYIDGLWKVNSNELIVLSTIKSAIDQFTELWHASFSKALKAKLQKLNPVLATLEQIEWRASSQKIDKRVNKISKILPYAINIG